MHPEVADDHREARHARAEVVSRGGSRDETEEFRRTFRRYRAVYEKPLQG